MLRVAIFLVIAGVVHGGKLTCKDGLQGPSPEIMKMIGEKCKDPNVWGEGEGKKHPNCDQMCVAEILGYLTPDGKLSQDMYNTWIEADFLPQNQEFAKKHIGDCFAKFGSKIDYNDKMCVELKNFDTCGWSMVPSLKC